MSTLFKELKRLVVQRLKDKGITGEATLAVELAINMAQKNIARVRDFDELMVLDTTNAFTVSNKKVYHIVDDLKLERPKDIYSIRYMDDANSRKLTFIPPRELDSRVPYTEIVGTGRPSYYTRRGRYIELFRIPNEAKPLYISHSQWPAVLTNDNDATPYEDLDDVITTLAFDIALSILEEGVVGSWTVRAKELLGLSLVEEGTKPDVTYVAQPFEACPKKAVGEWWTNPFIKKDP